MTAREVITSLIDAGQTVATCESLTAGLLAATLADVPGASAALRGGLVTYATDLKHTLARVPQEVLVAHGPVARETAIAMARGVRDVCGADWGVSLTGVGVGGCRRPGEHWGGAYWGGRTGRNRSRIDRLIGGRSGRNPAPGGDGSIGGYGAGSGWSHRLSYPDSRRLEKNWKSGNKFPVSFVGVNDDEIYRSSR